jgi:polar amino acid transport system permease protein
VGPAIDWQIVVQRVFNPGPVFLSALWTTISIAVVSQAAGVLLGLVLALMRRSRIWPLRIFSYLYVLVFRGTPVIVQIFFVYFGANLLVGFDLFPREVSFGFIQVSGAIVAGIAALSLNEGAYMSEIIRSGIDAVDKGQLEAARSLGMWPGLAMRRIILPQAARVIIPPLGNEFNAMIKTTSLLSFIGVYEIFEDADIHYSTTFRPVEYFTAVAIWYLLLTTVWSLIQAVIENRLAVSERTEQPSFRERLMNAWAPVSAWRVGGSR